ncbi:MAG: hypothetical protein EPN60_17965 [Nevskiaceae bacterium]|nr:MAG: hypothetical protein EPO48_01155 [Nevskiaceae bacterium]TAM21713.1 MAG: hypothetical protein EPN60_17965 [Nevskiaceae bacterium]
MAAERQLLSVLERKLKQRFQETDERTLAAIRKKWESVSPAPNCPSAHEVLKEIHGICAAGITQRKEESLKIVLETVGPYPSGVSEALAASLKTLTKQLFPRNLYVGCAQKTADVFRRKGAPSIKLSERACQLEMSLIVITSANLAERSIAAIHTCIEELQLQKPVPIERNFGSKALLFWKSNWQWIIGTILTIAGLVFSR